MNKIVKRLVTYAMILSIMATQTVSAEEVVVDGKDEEYTSVQVTCYMEPGSPTCTGSYRMDGTTAASKPEWLGYCAYLYKINEDGSLGDFIDIVEFNDIGYGAPVGHGTKSDLRKGKSAGTIETGKTIDIRKSSMSQCKEFMKATYTGNGTTGSQVYMILVDGEG